MSRLRSRTGLGRATAKLTWTVVAGVIVTVISSVILKVFPLDARAPTLPSPSPSKTPFAIGAAGRDGPFVVTVLSARCGLRQFPFDGGARTPQGQYCVVEAKFENRGFEAVAAPRFPLPTMFVGPEKYAATDTLGTAYTRDVFPGHSAEGMIVFDIPAGADPTLVEIPGDYDDAKLMFAV